MSKTRFGRNITRRDFVNGVAVGVGLAAMPQTRHAFGQTAGSFDQQLVGDDWYGYGGVGPYGSSHGNTPEVVNTAHLLRDRRLPTEFDVEHTEECDMAIVGGGMAGLGAALEFSDKRGTDQTCVLLDNHPMIGGEAKENEFSVNGERLIAPQGANGFFVPPPSGDYGDPYYYAKLGIPREFTFRDWPAEQKPLRFCNDNYGYLVAGLQNKTSTGHFFANDDRQKDAWAIDPFSNQLADTPLNTKAKANLARWFAAGNLKDFHNAEDARRGLDTMSYEEFLKSALGAGDEGARHADLFLASACGLGSDAVSAYAAYQLPMPGLFDSLLLGSSRRVSFPGGNSGFVRHFLKRLIPEAIAGESTFEEIVTNPINPAALDRPGQPIRMRTNSTVLSVAHDGQPGDSEAVSLIYKRSGKYYGLRAKSVVMATGSWITKHVVRDLPETHMAACSEFLHAPFLVANVALTNWRFLHKLGCTAAIWDRDDDGFGFTCNIRNPMQIGQYNPPLHPDQPIVLSFYTPFHRPGLDPKAQVAMGRAELLSTSYKQYESKILKQMLRLFGSSGFDPERDVAGLILNRWGHAYSVPYPGFYGGASGQGPGDVLRTNVGRISFAHSELAGLQHYGPAADEGRRAYQQVAGLL
jgi:spermidine dehydrogenase